MVRSRAVLAHLLPSVLVLALIASLVLFAWYPYPFLQFGDSGKFALLLLISACFVGPALTWFVYKKNKLAMAFDLIIIILVQLAAFTWGAYNLHQNRPYFMVFTVDRFEVLSIRQVDISSIDNPEFRDKPFSSPILLYANMPKDGEAFQNLLREVMFEGKPDLQFRPEFWSPYAQRQQLVLEKSQPLSELRDARPGSGASIDTLVKNNGGDIAALTYVPVMFADGHFAAILHANSGELLDTLLIDPWVN